MATITFNDQANAENGEVHFVFGATDFTLKPGGSYETDDPDVIREAINHSYLKVELSENQTSQAELEAIRKAQAESTDPTVNSHADHLSPVADPAVVQAAQERAQRDRLVAAGLDPDNPPEEAPTDPSAAPQPQPSGVASAPAPVPPTPEHPNVFEPETDTTQETHE